MKHIDLTDMLRVTRKISLFPFHSTSYLLQRWEPHQYYEDGVYKTLYGWATAEQVLTALRQIEVDQSVIHKFSKFAGATP